MYKSLQYNIIWTLYLLFYNPDGTTSSRMKRNHSAFQDFISCTFLDLTWHYSFHPPSTIILLAIFADMHWLENILYFIKALLSSSTRCHVAFKQQLPLTFYTHIKSKLDLGFSQTLQRKVVLLFLSLFGILLFFLQMNS